MLTYKRRPDGDYICWPVRTKERGDGCGALISGDPDMRAKHSRWHADLQGQLTEHEQEIAGIPQT